MGKNGSKWRHDYIPLNLAAASLKAHGSKSGARKALGSGKSKVAARRKIAASTRAAEKAIAPRSGQHPRRAEIDRLVTQATAAGGVRTGKGRRLLTQARKASQQVSPSFVPGSAARSR